MSVRKMVPQRLTQHDFQTDIGNGSGNGAVQTLVLMQGLRPGMWSDPSPARRILTITAVAALSGLVGVSLLSGVSAGAITALAGLAVLLLVLQLGLTACTLMPVRRGAVCGDTDAPCGDGPYRPACSSALRMPVFSVHIPIHNEPPALVIASLRALALQTAGRPCDVPDYEMIVLDNNTAKPALWEPVATWCKAQGHPFRFVHRMGVTGAKAGALNIALELTNPAATHVIIIDADYQVSPGFLALAGRLAAQRDVALWQFPQSYRNVDIQRNGVALELGDYFFRHAQGVANSGAMLPTGTLSIIERSALRAVGNWSSNTKTEDAELGLRLLGAGFRTRFLPQVVGTGLLPLDLAGLRIQRRRWAGGNTRALWLLLTGNLGLAGRMTQHDWLPGGVSKPCWFLLCSCGPIG